MNPTPTFVFAGTLALALSLILSACTVGPDYRGPPAVGAGSASFVRAPGRVAVRIGYSETWAHQLLAGGDMLLHGARFEPCGLTPLYAMHYGAVPIVRAVGGLRDSVTDADEPALADGSAACRELGLEVGALKLVVVENRPGLHNLVVCTLCSCYPRPLLGLPPDWYKSRAYRSRAVREPRAVLAEFGTPIPDEVEVRVHDSTADMRYLVLPERPSGTEGWDEARLAALVSRDSMIGVAQVDKV